jgi:hypothetical protein
MSDQKIEELRQLIRKVGPVLLIDLVQLMPSAMLEQALAIAEGMTDRRLRERALRALAKRLPAPQGARILAELPAGGATSGGASPILTAQLRRILSNFSEAEQENLIKRALAEIKKMAQQKKSAKPPVTLGGGVVISQRPPAKKRGSKGGSKGGVTEDARPKEGAPRASGILVPKMAPPVGVGDDVDLASGSTKSVDDGSNWPIGGSGFPDDALAGGGPPPPKKPRETAASSEDTSKRKDIVNIGFSKRTSPDTTDAKETLKCGETYLFWLEVGEARADSIEVNETAIRVEELPKEEKLVVALFTFQDELEMVEGEDIGELRITESMSVEAARQPMGAKAKRLASERLKTCLFFPVRVPVRAGVFRLRCNIYCKQTLIQSRLISVVARESEPQTVDAAFFKKEPALFSNESPHAQYQVALYSEADFVLSQALTPALLPQTPHRLSLMLNSNGNGTHSFRFFGKQGTGYLKDDATLDEGELTDFVKQGRFALRQASWGTIEEWDNKLPYLYENNSFNPISDAGKLARELVRLAVTGSRAYTEIIRKLTKDKQTQKQLRQLMAQPGFVQIALKKSSRHVFPAALLYDYPYDIGELELNTSTFELCKSFDAAMRGSAPLEEADCFKGKCWLKAEHDKNPTDLVGDLASYVCPSGFWGYRHALGFPLTLNEAADVPEEMTLRDSLQVVYGYSTDFDPAEHVQKLQGVRKPLEWYPAKRRGDVLQLLLSQKPHLVYFYCHGGVSQFGVPYIEVGEKDRLDANNFSVNFSETNWEDPRPLVFINGCHTTAMSPEVAVKLVEAFVQDAGASGVIGTEITIFEPLARAFAEDCLRRFLGGDPFTEPVPLGEAVRGARLALLKQGNPLGLVYIPFASASLRLVKR